MKKIISLVLMLSAVLTTTVFADAVPVITTTTDREIRLDVPAGTFSDGVFMVPVRRVCEIFDASCDWYEEDKMIILNTRDNMTRVFLFWEKETFRIFTFTGAITGTGADYELEAPLLVQNDRTLVPFEQICKALNGECEWSEDRSSVVVKVNEQDMDEKAEMYLVADKEDVAAGEEVEFSVYAKNTDVLPEHMLSGYSVGVIYDKTQFEYIKTILLDKEGTEVLALNLESAAYTADSSKAVCYAAEPIETSGDEFCFGKVILKSLTDDGGEVKLSNRVYTDGDDTHLIYSKAGEGFTLLNRGTELVINTDPVVVK